MKRPLRIGVLGHWGGNIGHDVMALGVECILKAAFDGQASWERIEQHQPLDIYPRGHPLRHAVTLRHGKGGRVAGLIKHLVNKRGVSKLLWSSSWVGGLDVAVACGGPMIAPNISRGDLDLTFHHMLGAFSSKGLPVMNLSVGSCYPLENIPDNIPNKDDEAFIRRNLEYASITTVRDDLAQQLCANIGTPCQLVPDTGFVAGEALCEFVSHQDEQQYVVINYQRYGANEDWGQNVDPMVWRHTIKSLIEKIRCRYHIVFLCHNDRELKLAKELDDSVPRYQPESLRGYAQFLSGAIAGICSRIHAAVAMASLGVPSVVVGTDSRLGTVQAIGLRCFFVKEASAELIEDTFQSLIDDRGMEHERLMALRKETLKRYVGLVRDEVHF